MRPDFSDPFYAMLIKVVAVSVVSAIVVVCLGLIYLTVAFMIYVS